MSTVESRYRDIQRVMHLLRCEADRQVLSRALGMVLIVVAGGALAALSPLVLKSLVDTVAAPPPASGARWLSALPCGVAYLLLLLTGRALSDVRPLLSGTINQRLHSRLAQRFFDHVLHLPMDYLLRRRSGELQHSLDLASAGAQLIISHLAGSLLPVEVELFTMTTVLIHLGQPGLIVVFGVAALAYFVIFSTGARRMTKTAHAASKSSLEAYARLGEGLAHVETLRYFAAEDQASRGLRAASAVLEQQWRRLDRWNAVTALAASAVFGVSMAACLAIGADAVARQAMSVGGFVLTTVYALQMVRPLESLGTAARDLSRALGYLRPLIDLLAEPLAEDAPNAVRTEPTHERGQRRAPAVRLENLHFGYDPHRPVIKGVNLEVPAGSTTAIVGRSGSGKSSLARLLMRLYSPQQGRILFDGRTIASIDVAELRRTLVGLVPQETTLLHDSIAGNIALGSPLADRDEILVAARAAQLEELIATLPEGLDTPVGERGMQLSGGERQRVGIARASAEAARPLRAGRAHLDAGQPDRARDPEGAARALRRCHPHRHRASAIDHRGCGRDRGAGRRPDPTSAAAIAHLLAKNGLYARMWRQQMAGAP